MLISCSEAAWFRVTKVHRKCDYWREVKMASDDDDLQYGHVRRRPHVMGGHRRRVDKEWCLHGRKEMDEVVPITKYRITTRLVLTAGLRGSARGVPRVRGRPDSFSSLASVVPFPTFSVPASPNASERHGPSYASLNPVRADWHRPLCFGLPYTQILGPTPYFPQAESAMHRLWGGGCLARSLGVV
jgi:hypothetical protein